MRDALFDGGKYSPKGILGYAKSIGLDNSSFKTCLTSGQYNEGIKQDIKDARNAGITGTPGFVVGRITENMVQGTLISGTRPFITFKAEIDTRIHPLAGEATGQVLIKPSIPSSRQRKLLLVGPHA